MVQLCAETKWLQSIERQIRHRRFNFGTRHTRSKSLLVREFEEFEHGMAETRTQWIPFSLSMQKLFHKLFSLCFCRLVCLPLSCCLCTCAWNCVRTRACIIIVCAFAWTICAHQQIIISRETLFIPRQLHCDSPKRARNVPVIKYTIPFHCWKSNYCIFFFCRWWVCVCVCVCIRSKSDQPSSYCIQIYCPCHSKYTFDDVNIKR